MNKAAALLAMMMALLVVARADQHSDPDPFGFLHPTIQFSDDERQRLDGRAVVLRILPAGGRELAALAAGAVEVGPDALVESVKNIVDLKKGALVPQIGRFSSPPRLEDVQPLTLDDVDMEAIRRCRPDGCALKLTAEEIERLQRASDINTEFRRVIVDRTAEYLRRGEDLTKEESAQLVRHSPYIQARMPELVSYLDRFPAERLAGSESFLYWSKETYAWKPMISVTHVTILRGSGGAAPEVVIASRDVFATRYTSGSLVLTFLFHNPSTSRRYLVYINRTWVDAVRALWRPFVEHRIKSQARNVFNDARARIERYGRAARSGFSGK